MKPIPAWKLKREFNRIVAQVSHALPIMWEYLTLTPRYDFLLSRKRKRYRGTKQLSAEVAVYLIFPKDGLLKSHLQMLAELDKQNIAPVVVSNYPLSSDDLDRLKSLCAVIIERPNVGYDFGGYRDAIRELAPRLSSLDRLFILNDSVWMLDSKKSWFDAVREADKDFCGATSNYGIRRYSDLDFRELVWEYTPDHWNFHYASYALAIGNRILQDRDFLRFWKRFRLSNSKKRTVRRGEIGLSKWMKEKGYSHTATSDVHNIDKEMRALEPDDLQKVFEHLVLPESPRLVKKRDEVAQTDLHSAEGMSDRLNFILMSVSSLAIGYVLPYYTINSRGFQFIKKSPLWLSEDSASITMEILENLEGPLGRQACLEAKDILKT